MRYFYSLDKEKYSDMMAHSIEYAEEVYLSDMKYEISELEYYLINEDDKLELIKRYFNRKIKEYEELNTIYKIAYESCNYSLEEYISDDVYYDILDMDALDKIQSAQDTREEQILYHIVRGMEAKLNEPFSDSESEMIHSEYAKQMKNISDVMIETHIKKNKYNMASNYLRLLEESPEIYISFDNFGNLNPTENKGLITVLSDKDDYRFLTDLMINEGVVSKCDETLSLIKINGLSHKKLICCLGHVLTQRNYLNTTNQTKIAKALADSFDEKISKALYGKNILEFSGYAPVVSKFGKELNDKTGEYLSTYHFIPEK